MLDQFKPGQTIRCTITARPGADDRRQTIARLMRRDPQIKKGLRKAQAHRARTTRSYIRGGREWFVRPKASRLAHPEPGNSWTMPFTPEILPDLQSVSDFVKVEVA